MADVLTNLRETSFCMGFVVDVLPNIPKDYKNIINNWIEYPTNNCMKISENNNFFSERELKTITKGYELGKYTKEKMEIQDISSIKWVGGSKTFDVIDVIINDKYKFSLKENSYILKNMGLYEILNIITNTKSHKRGLNVFEEFSNGTILLLFNYVKQEIIRYLTNNKEFTAKKAYIMTYNNDILYLELNAKHKNIPNFSLSSYYDVKKLINNKEFEQTISKFIRYELQQKNDQAYNKIKLDNSLITATNLMSYINAKAILFNNPSLINLFNIYDYNYFYAKCDKSLDLYFVPDSQNLTQNIFIKDIETSVAKTQLNLITTLCNKVNGKELILINQLRYSHGQLNGSPEAKLYISPQSSLDFIYNKI